MRKEVWLLCSEDKIKIKDNLGMFPKLDELFTSFFNMDVNEEYGWEGKIANGNEYIEMEITASKVEGKLNALRLEALDNLHLIILKELAHEIASPLTRILNNFIRSGAVLYMIGI